MPAVTPAEPHNPDLCGSSKRHPARTPARSTSTRRRRKVEQAARLPTPASPWSKQSCLPHRQFMWSKPPGLPCRRSRRQSDTIPTCAGAPNAIQPARLRAPPQPAPSFPISVSSVSSVVCFSPCSLWFAFSVFSVVCFLRVLRVLCGLLFCVSSVFSVVCLLRALPTPSHNLPQIFFPFLFNHLPSPPFSLSCSPLVC